MRQIAGTDDKDHAATQRETGFWGKKGAGVLPYCSSTKRFLLGLRSGEVEEPLTWGTFGGALDGGENIEKGAIREFREETKYKGPLTMTPLLVFKSGSFAFHNFLAVIPKEFNPKLDWENTAHAWRRWNDFQHPQHFGLVALLQHKESLATIKAFL